MSYPEQFSAAITWHYIGGSGRLDIAPGRLFASLDIITMTISRQNYAIHEAADVRVFATRKHTGFARAAVVCESPRITVIARPRFRTLEQVVETLRECGFKPEVEETSFVDEVLPILLWRNVR